MKKLNHKIGSYDNGLSLFVYDDLGTKRLVTRAEQGSLGVYGVNFSGLQRDVRQRQGHCGSTCEPYVQLVAACIQRSKGSTCLESNIGKHDRSTPQGYVHSRSIR